MKPQPGCRSKNELENQCISIVGCFFDTQMRFRQLFLHCTVS